MIRELLMSWLVAVSEYAAFIFVQCPPFSFLFSVIIAQLDPLKQKDSCDEVDLINNLSVQDTASI